MRRLRHSHAREKQEEIIDATIEAFDSSSEDQKCSGDDGECFCQASSLRQFLPSASRLYDYCHAEEHMLMSNQQLIGPGRITTIAVSGPSSSSTPVVDLSPRAIRIYSIE